MDQDEHLGHQPRLCRRQVRLVAARAGGAARPADADVPHGRFDADGRGDDGSRRRAGGASGEALPRREPGHRARRGERGSRASDSRHCARRAALRRDDHQYAAHR